MNPLPLIIAILEAAPQLVDAIEQIVGAFKAGGSTAAKAAMIAPSVQASMATALKDLSTPVVQ